MSKLFSDNTNKHLKFIAVEQDFNLSIMYLLCVFHLFQATTFPTSILATTSGNNRILMLDNLPLAIVRRPRTVQTVLAHATAVAYVCVHHFGRDHTYGSQ